MVSLGVVFGGTVTVKITSAWRTSAVTSSGSDGGELL